MTLKSPLLSLEGDRNSVIPTLLTFSFAPPRVGQAGLWESRGFCEVPRTLGNTGSFTLGFTTSR